MIKLTEAQIAKYSLKVCLGLLSACITAIIIGSLVMINNDNVVWNIVKVITWIIMALCIIWWTILFKKYHYMYY